MVTVVKLRSIQESRIPKERTKHAPLVVASGHPRVWTLAGPAVAVCGLLQTLVYACSIRPHVHRGNSTLEFGMPSCVASEHYGLEA